MLLPGQSKRKKTYKTLAIIGNGFDLAHGFHTDFTSFAEHTSDLALNSFKKLCENNDYSTTWYLFEENIAYLTTQMFHASMQEDADYDTCRSAISNLNNTFRQIHQLLLIYLKQETRRIPVRKLASVRKFFKRKTKVLTFNYTDIAQAYSKDIFYVHGSLMEDDILLGYDTRMEPDLTQYEDICWSKNLCREALSFRRYLKNELHLTLGNPRYSALISSLEDYQGCENSGRGFDDNIEEDIPDFSLVDSFIKRYHNQGEIPDISYKKIRTIVVLGHGIEADRVFLKQILQKCTHLKKVVIFRYSGESDLSFEKKASFFRPYCKRIRSVKY